MPSTRATRCSASCATRRRSTSPSRSTSTSPAAHSAPWRWAASTPTRRCSPMDDLIGQIGYVAILIGTFLEGESVLALGGVAAAYGYLTFWKVIAVGATGAFLGDQCCFY